MPAAEAAIGAVSPAFAAGYGTASRSLCDVCRRFFWHRIERFLSRAICVPSGHGYSRPPKVALHAVSDFLQLSRQMRMCNSLPGKFPDPRIRRGATSQSLREPALYSLRIDHNINTNNRLTLRMNVSPSTVTGIEVNGENQVFGQNAYSRTSEQTYRDLSGVLQDTWTIGNNKVNEFRFQYARRG